MSEIIKKLCSDIFSRKETLRFVSDIVLSFYQLTEQFACKLSLRLQVNSIPLRQILSPRGMIAVDLALEDRVVEECF